jgi:hypothetical protein
MFSESGSDEIARASTRATLRVCALSFAHRTAKLRSRAAVPDASRSLQRRGIRRAGRVANASPAARAKALGILDAPGARGYLRRGFRM